MRRLLIFILCLIFTSTAQAAEYLDGYIVLANKDTVKCKFKAGGFIRSTSFNRIVIITEQGEEQVFRAHDKKILGYGFVERGRRYDFLFVDVKPKAESGFYQRIVDGDKYKLYAHVLSSQGYPGISTAQPQYVLFNTAGAFEKFETCVLCPWKKQLRQLLKDDANALEILENTSRLEIPNFVVAINKE